MKKLICLCLAMAAVFALAAGCQGGKTIGPTEPTTVAVGEADLNDAAGQLGGDLDEDALEALRKALEIGAVIPEETQPAETMPPPMPTGVQTDAAEARALMKKVLDTMRSGKFTLKARSSSPFIAGGNAATPMTVAMDANAMAFEWEMDWIDMFKSEGQNPVTARIQGASAQTLFGKRMRIVTKTDGMMVVLVDKKMYMPMGAGEEGGEPLDFDLPSAMGEMFGGGGSQEEMEKMLNEATATRVTTDGKEYLCATTVRAADNTISRYYFLNGELKRLEAQNEGGETVMWEVLSLTSQVDPALFGTAGLSAMPLDQMAELGSNLGGLY
ncbi:MAG: hypothetical protein LBB75_01425 [Oscillospiraceae bacterium]|nr:hypothetical protein [Oscillospiraceae bacterium]